MTKAIEWGKHKLVDIQPMTAPSGQIFTMRVRYTDGKYDAYDRAMKVIEEHRNKR